jgi:hypothetical protein
VNYVLWADNTTFVPQLLGQGGTNTSVPLLIYQTANISLGGPSRDMPVFRPFYWVGLSSANTSVDLEMTTNQLLLTGRWSNLTSDHLVIENLATGDEKSVQYADPVALDCTNCLWYLAFDRCVCCVCVGGGGGAEGGQAGWGGTKGARLAEGQPQPPGGLPQGHDVAAAARHKQDVAAALP